MPTLVQTIQFIYSEKATNFCEISTVNMPYVVTVKSKMEIQQNFVAQSEYMNFIICRPGFENLRTVQLKCRFTTGVKLFLNLHSYINTPAYSLNYFMKYCSRKIQVLKNWNAPSEKITPNCGAASSVLHCSLDVLIRNSRETVGDVKMIIKCRWILKNFFQYCKIMKISTRVKYIPP